VHIYSSHTSVVFTAILPWHHHLADVGLDITVWYHVGPSCKSMRVKQNNDVCGLGIII